MQSIEFSVVAGDKICFTPAHLIIASWAGRDVAKVETQIRALEAIGVARPVTTPCYYALSPALLSTVPVLAVPRENSSGEVECVLFSVEDGSLYVGLGSDHTDRVVEAYDVTVSKQMCAKPVSSALWRFDEVAGHWDSLIMRCWRTRDGVRVLYQEGTTSSLRDPRELIALYTCGASLAVGTVMFCGTQAVIGDLGHGDVFEMELYDPILDRKLSLKYDVATLKVA